METLIVVLVVAGLLVAVVWWVMSDYLTSKDKTRFRTRMADKQMRDERKRRAAVAPKIPDHMKQSTAWKAHEREEERERRNRGSGN